MAIRNNKLGGTDFTSGELLTAANLNDTYDAVLEYGGISVETKSTDFSASPKRYVITGSDVSITLSGSNFELGQGVIIQNREGTSNITLTGNDYILYLDSVYQNLTKSQNYSTYELNYVGPYVISYNIAEASYDSVSFSVASEESNPASIFFKSDGTKMYMIGFDTDSVHQYTLSTAWDLSTASYDSVSFSVASQETIPRGIFFKSDGTKMYMIGFDTNSVYQYTLSTAWDLSTASYDSVSFSVASEESSPPGIFFKSDGTKMYMTGTDMDSVHQYTLSTAWDLSTASYDSVSFNVASEESIPRDIFFKSDGTKMYIIGNKTDSVHQYTLSTAWDLSTASYDSVSFSVASEESNPASIFLKSDGTKMYITGYDTDSVHQYTTSTMVDNGYQLVNLIGSVTLS